MSVSTSMSSSPSPFPFSELDLDDPPSNHLNLDRTSFSLSTSSGYSVVEQDLTIPHTRSSSAFPSDLSGSTTPFDPAWFNHNHTTPFAFPKATEVPPSTVQTPFFSPIGSLHSVPLTPWPYPYGQQPTAPLPADYSTPTHSTLINGAISPWSDAKPINTSMHTSMPPPPPNTAALPLHGAPGSSTLSPLFAGFSTESPLSATISQAGLLRGWTYSPAQVLNGRKRSSTMFTGPLSSADSVPPATPNSGLSVYSTQSPVGYHPYPYPSPRSSASTTSFGAFTPGFMGRRTTVSTFTPVAMANYDSSVAENQAGFTSLKRVFHPSAPAEPGTLDLDLRLRNSFDAQTYNLPGLIDGNTTAGAASVDGMTGASMGDVMTPGFGAGIGGSTVIGDAKPPRFKPTKEQLEILVAAYNENQSPDASYRDALARRLGPDVRPKTLQIWFQNRRSKARAKDKNTVIKGSYARERSSPCSSLSPPRRGSTASLRRSIDMSALKALVRDDKSEMDVLPVTVVSVSNWARFLTPGSGLTNPDVGAALHRSELKMYLYVVHLRETFRISLPISSTAISSLNAVQGPSDSMAINFQLDPGKAEFACWTDDMSLSSLGSLGTGSQSLTRKGGEWRTIADFTGGEATRGGRCELTGYTETLSPAYTAIRGLLDRPMNQGASLQTWKFPLDPMTTWSSEGSTLKPDTLTPVPKSSTECTPLDAQPTSTPVHHFHATTGFASHARQKSGSTPHRPDPLITEFLPPSHLCQAVPVQSTPLFSASDTGISGRSFQWSSLGSGMAVPPPMETPLSVNGETSYSGFPLSTLPGLAERPQDASNAGATEVMSGMNVGEVASPLSAAVHSPTHLRGNGLVGYQSFGSFLETSTVKHEELKM